MACCGTTSWPTPRRTTRPISSPPFASRCCGASAPTTACPQAFEADLASPLTFVDLEHLHLDHEQEVDITCDMWVRAIAALPHGPGWWDDDVDDGLLCQLLFGMCDDPVCGASMLHFRFRAAPCHRLNMPHYCTASRPGRVTEHPRGGGWAVF